MRRPLTLWKRARLRCLLGGGGSMPAPIAVTPARTPELPIAVEVAAPAPIARIAPPTQPRRIKIDPASIPSDMETRAASWGGVR